MKKVYRIALTVLLAVPLSGCGYWLYPERVGQKDGRIDPTVALLDGAACLLFLIPGIVAFAVDFHYGTIYLPPGQDGPYPDTGARAWKRVALHEAATPAAIEAAVLRETGLAVSLQDPRLQTYRAQASQLEGLVVAYR